MQVLHDVVEAVQPGRNTGGNDATEKETNGAGHGRGLDLGPSTAPLRVAVNHERMAAAQNSELTEKGASACLHGRQNKATATYRGQFMQTLQMSVTHPGCVADNAHPTTLNQVQLLHHF